MKKVRIRRRNAPPARVVIKADWVATSFHDPFRDQRAVKEVVVYTDKPPTIMPRTLEFERGSS
jgi:hypothetical protein